MGTCIYCGSGAGLFSNKHKHCSEAAGRATYEISGLLPSLLGNNSEPTSLLTKLQEISASANLTDKEFKESIRIGLLRLKDRILEDGVVTEQEESVVTSLLAKLESLIDTRTLNLIQTELVKALILGDLSEGRVVNRLVFQDLPVMLKPKETVLWAFSGVKYFAYRRNRQFVSGSRGVSVRVAKGLYFRAGASKGKSIITDDLTHEDTGVFVISDRAVYFKGAKTSLNIDVRKILFVQPYADSIELSDARRNSKPMFFGVGDPVFAANVILNLRNLEQ